MTSRLFLGIVALASMAACTAVERDATDVDQANLIGGIALKDGDLPSTLWVNGYCTGTKVGARHILLAAHCVFGSEDFFSAGLKIDVSAAVSETDGTPRQKLTIKDVHIAPEWLANCHLDDDNCFVVGANNEHLPSDVALIETKEEIAHVPIAAIDTEPLAPGEAVIVAGFGCENYVGEPSLSTSYRLRADVVRVLPPSALLHWGSHVTEATAPVVSAHDFVTPGPAWGTPGPGLCPGDSGGAVYRAKAGGATVVGVNHSYTFAGRWGGLPVTNLHARLDTATPSNVGAWLASLGATTCSGASCPTRVPAAALSSTPPMPSPSASLASQGRDRQCQDSITDASKVEAELDHALAPKLTLCTSTGPHRVPGTNDAYSYEAVASCRFLDDAPITAADEARLPAGFTVRDGKITRPLQSPPCASFPTGDTGCRATLVSPEKLDEAVKLALRLSAACSLESPQLENGAYSAPFTCVVEHGLPPDVIPTHAAVELWRVGYGFYFDNVRYDVAQHAFHGVAHSMSCDLFQ